MSNAFQAIDGQPIYWQDKAGVVHSCEGADVHRGVRLIWTLCNRDVPANEAYKDSGSSITCSRCLNPEKSDGGVESRHAGNCQSQNNGRAGLAPGPSGLNALLRRARLDIEASIILFVGFADRERANRSRKTIKLIDEYLAAPTPALCSNKREVE